ncbi:Rid family detoxifying hydrolase [Sneathia sanguinegens]|uniref:Rid family detoxifying hydrolase n=1 Tax=Sneathia sanguinegens TaxID=40543 RepID=A0ABT7HIH9_9FUSO|nr:Rid family detoxifying hydrolase [Sneathia sanguinegens]MDK9580319.1 Rid family detoxifying hydrolase [Sneathia sanguinegens]
MENLIPKAVGPYSAYRMVGDYLYVSGQIGLDPTVNELKEGLEEQAKQVFTNIKNILAVNGMTMDNVVKTTVLLDDIKDFVKVNEIYATFFKEPYPTRSAFSVKALPKGALVEVEVLAHK